MKKYFVSLIVSFVFIVSTVSFVFGAESTFPYDNSVWFREGVRQMGQDPQKAVQAFADGCNHRDIPSCSMIAIAAMSDTETISISNGDKTIDTFYPISCLIYKRLKKL